MFQFASHVGFVVEGVVEALPQSLLQMTAVVMYGDVKPINIISIVVSMCVVCAK